MFSIRSQKICDYGSWDKVELTRWARAAVTGLISPASFEKLHRPLMPPGRLAGLKGA